MQDLTVISKIFLIADQYKQVRTIHFGLYMALLECWNEQHCQSPFFISRSKLMALSRIRSTSTYHICIKNLQDCGAILYQPSYHPKKGTMVTLNL